MASDAFFSGLAQTQLPDHFFFMDKKTLAQKVGVKLFLQRLVLVSVLPAENVWRLALMSLPLWAFCTLLFVGYELAPAFEWVCMCLTTGGGGECWQDWTHHCTVGDGWGSDLRHLVGQNQNLQVSPLFASVPWWLCSSSILCKEQPCAVASWQSGDWVIGRICREKIGFFKTQLV